ncbi:flagellar basal body-associated FliL family protein [Cochlodiniinecator piscidefendens]|uniref:flagellar basal body-associated FliL family protein n=1 Tax=Cochlodiniinecator piscidefendens TaxID=2715756 RepID=UPI00140CE890|nr:flagellar basal body-associated FliL family protein [Cochlodiniinecator piscidefendens]
MAEEELPAEDGEVVPKKKSKLPLILGLVLAIAGGGGGFYAVSSGMILGDGTEHAEEESEDLEEIDALPAIAFIPVDPLIVSLRPGSTSSYLRFTAQLEVADGYSEDVTTLMPRILDVLNGYLRAVNIEELEDPSALIKLRAQMLRRVQTVVGEGRVRDLLIMEFVLS